MGEKERDASKRGAPVRPAALRQALNAGVKVGFKKASDGVARLKGCRSNNMYG